MRDDPLLPFARERELLLLVARDLLLAEPERAGFEEELFALLERLLPEDFVVRVRLEAALPPWPLADELLRLPSRFELR